jgi:hypothetical protein
VRHDVSYVNSGFIEKGIVSMREFIQSSDEKKGKAQRGWVYRSEGISERGRMSLPIETRSEML